MCSRPSRRSRPFPPMPPTALPTGVSEHRARLPDLSRLTMRPGLRDRALDPSPSHPVDVDARQRENDR